MTPRTFELEAYHHMREHAGMSYQPSIETREQGAVRSALELARAEYVARHSAVYFAWQADDDPDLSWMDADARTELERGETAMMACVLYGADGESLASLWGIHMRDPWQADPYRRVIEAQLALEAGVCHPLDRAI
jgi:hypothetical protein